MLTTMILGASLAAAALLAAPPAPPTPPTAPTTPTPPATSERTFGEDAAFLAKHQKTIVLSSKDGRAKIAVVPAYQGRVLTSTAGGDGGTSYGFIKYDLIESGAIQEKINPVGGEDRFWLGPEGGQFAIFFKKGDEFSLKDWKTPAAIDTEAYAVVAQDESSVTFTHGASFTNYSGFALDVKIHRVVRLLENEAVKADLGSTARSDGASWVAYESVNTITNTGKAAWTEETGMLSVWILGMFKPSAEAVVVIPYKPGSEEKLGPVVNDSYFGKVPADRLVVGEKAIFFKADGQMRSKIGVSPRRAMPTIGSYDPARNVLTLVTYTLPVERTTKGVELRHPYVNSMWEIQKEPFAGDAVNGYNDGASKPGEAPFGPFYELETSSPAAALKPGESLTHTSRTVHIEGTPEQLDAIAIKALGVSLETIRSALKK